MAQNLVTTSKNMYGTPGGLIDMPTAEMAHDGELSSTVSHFGGTSKTTLTFQITPRLTGSFRYSALNEYRPGRGGPNPYPNGTYYDRSFDLRYQLLTEGQYRPGVAVGLRDFIGTGLYGSEYVVATKSIGDRLRLTGGVGWGRLGSFNSFATTGTRPTGVIGSGGLPTTDRWFRGPVAGFGGISYQATDRLSFKAEYSSDAYLEERGGGQDPGSNMFQRKSPWNFGLDYQVSRSVNVGAYYLYGSEVGLSVTVALDPKSSPVPGGADTAPLPVAMRPRFSASDLGWKTQPGAEDSLRAQVAETLAGEGLILEGIRLEGTRAHVLLRNTRYDVEAQAVGRAARVLSRTLPPSVETFTIGQTFNGMPTGAVTMTRSDVERLENAPATDMFERVTFGGDAGAWAGMAPEGGSYPRFEWSLGPYAKLSVFDPDNPVKADIGARLSADYHVAPGWVLSGSVSAKMVGNLDDPPSGRSGAGPGTLPKVRSNARLYSMGNDPRIDHLTLARYGRLGEDWYSRVTFGYLEQMYAGISGEVLWKPVDSKLALGAELNYVAQRDFDQLFGVQNYTVATGHVSAYYDFGGGYHGQMDMGRYLAGDWGATVALDREFDNGWRVGAYVTKTNVSSAAFGEGSFDKGIRITVPLSWATGTATRRKNDIVIQSLTRDGGARLNVDGRLYEAVRDAHKPQMAKTWGKFWR
ncbi:YjbH domain-containing protein [Marimonas lutisalis]|uniref:YjbH domain-containing protein n=1 Tax=Marimonas lutisalis TaxID=2545756 RepID=UPI001F1DD6F3|nr:YjbH domain-containing protein [Marimonas lutisalis]